MGDSNIKPAENGDCDRDPRGRSGAAAPSPTTLSGRDAVTPQMDVLGALAAQIRAFRLSLGRDLLNDPAAVAGLLAGL